MLHAFGQVKAEALRMRYILLIEMGLEVVSDDGPLMTELPFFLQQVDDANVSAGNYLFFSPSFVVSFYGILTTYIAVMVQSI